MGKSILLFLTIIGACFVECQAIAISADNIPKDQQAQIEGLCYAAMLGPAVKENWPDLRSFNITSVTGDNVGAFSKTEAIIGPGPCTVTVEVKTSHRGTATLTLTFEAEAGGKYVLRPVYRGDKLAASIQNTNTGELVARTWPSKKPRSAPDSSALVDAP